MGHCFSIRTLRGKKEAQNLENLHFFVYFLPWNGESPIDIKEKDAILSRTGFGEAELLFLAGHVDVFELTHER